MHVYIKHMLFVNILASLIRESMREKERISQVIGKEKVSKNNPTHSKPDSEGNRKKERKRNNKKTKQFCCFKRNPNKSSSSEELLFSECLFYGFKQMKFGQCKCKD